METTMTPLQMMKFIHHDLNFRVKKDDTVDCHMAILRDWNDTAPLNKYEEIKRFAGYEEGMNDHLFTGSDYFSEIKRLSDLGVEDTYVSINNFWRQKKSENDIRHLNGFLLDFDYYKIPKYKDLSSKEFYELVKKDLPLQPNFVIDSGRGIYIIYCFKHCSKVKITYYKAIYKAFYNKLKQYGMDPKAMNTTQVFRLPGTINSKSLREVKILYADDEQYELCQIGDTVLPYTLNESKEYLMSKKVNVVEKKKSKIERLKAKYASNREIVAVKNLIRDLEELCRLRNGNMTGHREKTLFHCLEACMFVGMPDDVCFRYAKHINSLFNEPFEDDTIKKQCKPSKVFDHRSSGKKIINELEITENEQKYMFVLKTADFKKKKRQAKNRRNEFGRTKKQQEVFERREKIAEWISKGLSIKEIWVLYREFFKNVRKTFLADLKFIATHMDLFKVLNRKIGNNGERRNDTNEKKEMSEDAKLTIERLLSHYLLC